MKSSNASLKAQIAQDQAQSRKMEADIAEARMQFATVEQEGARLRNEVGMLRSHLSVTTHLLSLLQLVKFQNSNLKT